MILLLLSRPAVSSTNGHIYMQLTSPRQYILHATRETNVCAVWCVGRIQPRASRSRSARAIAAEARSRTHLKEPPPSRDAGLSALRAREAGRVDAQASATANSMRRPLHNGESDDPCKMTYSRIDLVKRPCNSCGRGRKSNEQAHRQSICSSQQHPTATRGDGFELPRSHLSAS